MTSDLSVPAPQPNPSTDDDFAAVDRYIAGREDASGIADELVRRYGGSGRAVELPGTLGGDDRLPADDDAVPIVPSARVDLDAIQARADAASPGPWVRSSEEVILGAVDEFSGLPRWVVALADLIHEADAQFIAAARSDVPALVGEVRRLRGALQAVRDRLGCSDWIVSAELLSALDAALDGAE